MTVLATDMGEQILLPRTVDYVVKQDGDRVVIASGGHHFLYFTTPEMIFFEQTRRNPKYPSLLVDLHKRGYFTKQVRASHTKQELAILRTVLADHAAIQAAHLLAGQLVPY